MDPITTVDSFKGIIVIGSLVQAFIFLVVLANNSFCMSLEMFASWFRFTFVAWFAAGFVVFAFQYYSESAIMGFIAACAVNFVIAASLTFAHQHQLTLEELVAEERRCS